MTDFLFSVPSGEPVTLEPFHYAIIGQTQFSGKTTLIKRLSEWVAAQGYKVLIFDTKETEADYVSFGNEVPVCLRETTDSFVLIGLLESMFKRRLTPYYATLSRLTEASKGFDDIIKRAKELEAKTKSNWLRDACRVLYDLLERLQSETSRVETVPQLKLYSGINRMPINDFSLEAQQLIMKNSFEDLLRIYKRKTIGVIDESFKFLPQGYSSAATRAVMNVITQGAKTGLYTWIATQFLAVTDKDPLKACAVKFLGTQDHITEVKHTLDLIPEARSKFSADDIMKLKLGHWILVRKRPPFVGVVYSLPVGVPEEVGREVALGKRSPESVRDDFLKPKMEVNEDLVWKERFEQLQKDVEKRIEEERKKAFKEALQKVEEIEKTYGNVEELRETIMKLKDEKAILEGRVRQLEILNEKFAKENNAFVKLKEGLLELLPTSMPVALPTSNTSIGLQHTATIMTVQSAEKNVTVNTETIRGKILALAQSGFLNAWHGLGDIYNALIEKFSWTVAKSSLQVELSRMVDEFLLGAKEDKGRGQRVYRLAEGVKFKEA
jgi:hypothetical protein